MSRPPIQVTNRAVLCWLAEVHGVKFNVDKIKAEIAEKAKLANKFDGACSVISGGLRFQLDENKVVGIMPKNLPKLTKRRAK